MEASKLKLFETELFWIFSSMLAKYTSMLILKYAWGSEAAARPCLEFNSTNYQFVLQNYRLL